MTQYESNWIHICQIDPKAILYACHVQSMLCVYIRGWIDWNWWSFDIICSPFFFEIFFLTFFLKFKAHAPGLGPTDLQEPTKVPKSYKHG